MGVATSSTEDWDAIAIEVDLGTGQRMEGGAIAKTIPR